MSSNKKATTSTKKKQGSESSTTDSVPSNTTSRRSQRTKNGVTNHGATNTATATNPAAIANTASGRRRRGAKALTSPQLCVLVCLSVWIGHSLDYRSASKKTGASDINSFCDKYFHPNATNTTTTSPQQLQSCTNLESAFISYRYTSSIISNGLIGIFALLCWSNEALLKRYCQFLLMGPMMGILASILRCVDAMNEQQVRSLSMTTMFLSAFTVFFNRTGKQPSRQFQIFSIANVALILVSLVGIVEVLQVLFSISSSTERSIDLLSLFVAVDLSSKIIVAVFSLFYFNSNQKSAALLFLAVASTFQYTWSIPKIMLDHDIRHDNNGDGTKREQDEEMKAFSTSMRSMLLGSILLSVVAAFIPDFYHLPPSGVPNNRKSSKKKSS